MWLTVLGLMVMGFLSWLSSASRSDSGCFLGVPASLSRGGYQCSPLDTCDVICLCVVISRGFPIHRLAGYAPKPWGFPHSSVSKECAYNAGDPGLIPGLGRSPGEGKGYPLQYLAWRIPWAVQSQSWTERLSFHSPQFWEVSSTHGLTPPLSFWSFMNSSGWWYFLSSESCTRTYHGKMTPASGYYRAWPGRAVSFSGSPDRNEIISF